MSSEHYETNSRRLESWCHRISESGSMAKCLIAVGPKFEELHICFPAGSTIEEMARLLEAALAEVRGDNAKVERGNPP